MALTCLVFSALYLLFNAAQPLPEPKNVVITTDVGEIEIRLHELQAPLTCTNFLKYVTAKHYDGGQFHRTVRPDNQPQNPVKIAVIQGGMDPAREKEQFAPIKLERTRLSGLKHLDGTVSMARDGPDTATADFFICLGEQPELDFGGKRNPDGQGFAAFGQVVRGMDVVRKIQQAPAEAQKLTPPVGILRIRRQDSSAGTTDWFGLSGETWRECFITPTGDWFGAESVVIDAKNPRRLAAKPGRGILINGPNGRTSNLVTKASYGDLDFACEFQVPKGSNSGVKMHGHYEIQIFDSWGVKHPKASDCGGIYPRAEELPTYHHIDEGIPPRTNACRPPGEWQRLEISFQAPRFDIAGKKTANARFLRVALNGTVVHDDVEVLTPTGAAWRLSKEVANGPILIQADHGPVAFRDIRVRPR